MFHQETYILCINNNIIKKTIPFVYLTEDKTYYTHCPNYRMQIPQSQFWVHIGYFMNLIKKYSILPLTWIRKPPVIFWVYILELIYIRSLPIFNILHSSNGCASNASNCLPLFSLFPQKGQINNMLCSFDAEGRLKVLVQCFPLFTVHIIELVKLSF